MSHHSSEHGGPGEHGGVHLPDPSIWPLVVGAAALFLGLALVFWTRDRGSDFSGPLLGAAVVATLVSAFGWAYEDGKMKRKAEQGPAAATPPRAARYTQVLTFSVIEGKLIQARMTGIVHILERADGALRDLDGFQDLRIIVAPATTGPSQVLVETTWSDREGLATYEETRRTLLDIVAAHSEEVASGSVQVFDMEVVRDTKDVSFRFGTGAAVGLIGALLIGGFMIGAGLNLFASDNTGGGGGAATVTPGVDTSKVVATDNKFSVSSIEAPPATAITINFSNNGKIKHNLHFLTAKGGTTLAPGAEGAIIDGGQSEAVSFTTPAAGNYYFQCDLHPDQMSGTFTVKAGAAVPGPAAAAAPGGTTAGGANAITATDNKFDKNALSGSAGKPVSITLTNNGKVPHNIHFLTQKGGATLADGGEAKILQAGGNESVTFTPPNAGKFYFQCDLHPDQMFGTFTVT
jgi:plastocyanin/heme-degrading monooxygenase HmoA